MRYYPIYLDLQSRPVLLVGGGVIAEGKGQQLVGVGARLHIVSPDLTPVLQALVEAGAVTWRCGAFVESDFEADELRNLFLVISATDDQLVNEAVARAAAARNILYNVVDQPALCNFITPALVTRGALQISVSTGGASPTVAQRVKREIGELIGNEYQELLEITAALRLQLRQQPLSFAERRDLLHAFVESEALELLRAGNRTEAEALAAQVLSQFASRRQTDLATD